MPFAQNFWHASSCSGKETLEVGAVLGGPSSRHAVTLCSWSPQALVQPWWRARRDASSLCPPAPRPDPAPGDHGPPQGAVAGSGAWGKPGPCQIPTSLLSDSAADRLTGLHWEIQVLTPSVKKKSIAPSERLACALLFWKHCFTSSETAAGGEASPRDEVPSLSLKVSSVSYSDFLPAGQAPVPWVALPACCHSAVPAGWHSQRPEVLHCHLTHNICWGSRFEIRKAT